MSSSQPDGDESSIAVVIPFFQREPGLLARCVGSVLAQEDPPSFRVIIIDDGSPVAARDELAHLRGDARITILKQANAGPGAARNRGLDAVPAGTPYVTFLDSDDRWTGPFLADAVHALDLGADLFFGDSQRGSQATSRFTWGDREAFNLRGEDHPVVDASRDLHAFNGDFFDFLVRRSNILSANTFAYRFERLPDIRFDPTLFNGQDRLFKLSLGQHLGRVLFSTRCYAEEGEGVNIFDKAQWGSPDSLRFLASYIRLARTILAEIALTPDQARYVTGQLLELRHAFIASTLHLIVRRRPVDWPRVWETLREDPATARLLPAACARILRQRLVRRRA